MESRTVETKIWEALDRNKSKDFLAEELLDLCEQEHKLGMQKVIDWVNENIKYGGNYSGKFTPAWQKQLEEWGLKGEQ